MNATAGPRAPGAQMMGFEGASGGYLRHDALKHFAVGTTVILETLDSFDGELAEVRSYDDQARKWTVGLHRCHIAETPLECAGEELRFGYRVDAAAAADRRVPIIATADDDSVAMASVAAGAPLFEERPVLVASAAPRDAAATRWAAYLELKRRAVVGRDGGAAAALAAFDALAPDVAAAPPGDRCGFCGSDRRALRCGRCKVAGYCGRDCQRKAWAAGSVQETPRNPGVFGLWRPLSRSHSSRFGSFLDR